MTWTGEDNEIREARRRYEECLKNAASLTAGMACADRYSRAHQQFEIRRQFVSLPTNSSERKGIPLVSGVLDYFPDALAAVALVSKAGNNKHNPGEPLHWTRGRSTDHADSLLRHLVDRGKVDTDTGQRHSAEVAWRALALLQEELEQAGAPLSRGSVPAPEEDRYAEQRSPRRIMPSDGPPPARMEGEV